MGLTGGQLLIGQLEREGVQDVFGVPGIQLDWAVDALRQAQGRIRFIVPRHEQAASYMADGYARSTGREGVSMVVPGPGVLNALTGLVTAYACNSRLLFIAGQIPSQSIGRGYGVLHEIPGQSDILRQLTKWHAIAREPGEIPALVNEAFRQLRSGRALPVALEIPPDVLEKSGDASLVEQAVSVPVAADPAALREAATLLRAARFPVIQAGGGATAANAGQALARLSARLQAPVVLTEGARGVLPSSDPLVLTGLGGRAVYPHADLVLAIGTRFLDGHSKPHHRNPDCRFIYLNVEAAHGAAPRQSGLLLQGDARRTLEALLPLLEGLPERPSRRGEMEAVKAWCEVQHRHIQPQWEYVQALRRALPDEAVFVSDLTQVGYFANVAMPIEQPRSFLTPGYQGTLGFAFPTSLGAAAGNPQRPVVSINGDGGFGWGLQELSTAARYRLGAIALVFVDGQFANVRRIQRRVFGEVFATEVEGPDLRLLASAFGVRFRGADDPAQLAEAVRESLREPGPVLIAARVGEMATPWPVIHPFVPASYPVPPNPLGEPRSLVTS
jgi:acetolactate synthase-1/2/3 large subunit